MATRSKSSSSSGSSISGLAPYGPFLLRLALGASMTYHGYEKVIPGHALDHYAHYIVTLGLPYWLGYISAFTEFVGGILVLIGLLTRFAGIMIAGNMLVALVKVNLHRSVNTSLELNLALIAMALAIFLLGGGIYALDRKIGFS